MGTQDEQNNNPATGLPFYAAEVDLKCGTPIALPEWGGFWFYKNDRIYVFTKDNEFLDTPDIEQYGKREDWLLVPFDYDLAVRFIKGLRLAIDKNYEEIPFQLIGNREVSSARTELQLAFMWLGNCLGELGNPNPYPKSMDAKSPVIEKHADKAERTAYALWPDPNETPDQRDLRETAYAKNLRNQVSIFLTGIDWLTENIFQRQAISVNRIYPFISSFTEVAKHLINSRLWFGQQLNNIRVRQEGIKAGDIAYTGSATVPGAGIVPISDEISNGFVADQMEQAEKRYHQHGSHDPIGDGRNDIKLDGPITNSPDGLDLSITNIQSYEGHENAFILSGFTINKDDADLLEEQLKRPTYGTFFPLNIAYHLIALVKDGDAVTGIISRAPAGSILPTGECDFILGIEYK